MLNALKTKNKILLFWGAMDLLALGMYLCSSLLRGNMPFYSDIVNFYQHLSVYGADEGPGAAIQTLFFVGLLMQISLFFSAYLFIVKTRINVVFIGLQEVLRFATLTCSISLFPLLLNLAGAHSLFLSLFCFIFSEACKIGSLWWNQKLATA